MRNLLFIEQLHARLLLLPLDLFFLLILRSSEKPSSFLRNEALHLFLLIIFISFCSLAVNHLLGFLTQGNSFWHDVFRTLAAQPVAVLLFLTTHLLLLWRRCERSKIVVGGWILAHSPHEVLQ